MTRLDDLKTACIAEDFDSIKAILDENPELLKSIDDSGLMLLHWLIHSKDNEAIEDPEKIVEFLLKNYAIDINQARHDGITALHEAVTYQQTDTVKVLLQHGAKILANDYGCTPLHLAILRNDIEITKLLLGKNADVYAKDENGDTPAHFAAAEDDPSSLNLLIENVSDPNALLLAKNNQQKTPFGIAMANTKFLADEKEELKKVLKGRNLAITNVIPADKILNENNHSALDVYKTDGPELANLPFFKRKRNFNDSDSDLKKENKSKKILCTRH